MTSWEGGRSDRGRTLRVGLLLLAAIVVTALGIFFIGEQNNLFTRKNRYVINFETVSGVNPGNPVQLDGVDVGAVEEVILPRDPNRKFIQVWIKVDRRYAERVRAPQRLPAAKSGLPAWTQARIKTLGLLGDKYVELTSGAPDYPPIPSGGRIPSAEPTNVDALIASGEDVMDNVVEISASLSTILARMERGEGLLGDLTSDSEAGRRMRESMVSTFERVERIAATVEHGNGPLPRLLNDQALADKLAASIDRFETLLANAQSGPGLLPALLNDPAARQSFDQTLATLNQVARDLQGMTADLESSEALLPKLLKDEEYGREVTGEVRQIVERLNSVAGKLDKGEGTASKLINDPQIYDAVNDIMVGINESRMLRWLIRNRQKAGIEKRFEDAGGKPGELRQPEPAPPGEELEELTTEPATAGEDLPAEPATPGEDVTTEPAAPGEDLTTDPPPAATSPDPSEGSTSPNDEPTSTTPPPSAPRQDAVPGAPHRSGPPAGPPA